MMRRDTPTIERTASFAEFRRRFPLGSVRVVTATEADGGYAGLIRVSSALPASTVWMAGGDPWVVSKVTFSPCFSK